MNTFTPIVSYAQNFEDVMLWRALHDVENGQYVDVGAQSAIEDSVSLAFHEKGWHGVHVEPVEAYAHELRVGRPGDIVIQAIVGERGGIAEFHAIPGTGLSTSNETIARRHLEEGLSVVHTAVPVVTLDDVLAMLNGDIHWLKIDVEGAEARVIEGWKGERRPWIVVVESTAPLSQKETSGEWEGTLIEKGYVFVYFDGLNRFYVHLMRETLRQAFQAGPNVFDRFQLSGTATSTFTRRLQDEISRGTDEIAVLKRKMGSMNELTSGLQHEVELCKENISVLQQNEAALMREIEDCERELSQTKESELKFRRDFAETLEQLIQTRHEFEIISERFQEEANRSRSSIIDLEWQRNHGWEYSASLSAKIEEIYRSTSWKLTAPLRMAKPVLSATLGFPGRFVRMMVSALKRSMLAVIFSGLRWSHDRPRASAFGKKMVQKFPKLERRVRAWRAHVFRQGKDRGHELRTSVAVSVQDAFAGAAVPAALAVDARRSLQRLRQMAGQVRR